MAAATVMSIVATALFVVAVVEAKYFDGNNRLCSSRKCSLDFHRLNVRPRK